jgi:hypothetical protein
VVPPSFDYTLEDSGTTSVTKTGGNVSDQNTITKTKILGDSYPVNLALSGVPPGTTALIANGACAPDPVCASVITFTVTPATLAGTYPITVTGSTASGVPSNRQTTFDLEIHGNPVSATCSASPTTALIGQIVTWTATVLGGTPPYSYAWSGTNIPTSPAPNTNPFNISYGTLGKKTALVRVTDFDNQQYFCAPGEVQVYFDPTFNEF